ncbi:Protein of unknown function [Cotesia congregata]|uniref:Uncharacterized protein n=1 Tax=Cotesia congregata TaxID=51543 RepID=A0A8J2HMP3_COTCN|nr:Protein of unknown function [Cotesia congregata]
MAHHLRPTRQYKSFGRRKVKVISEDMWVQWPRRNICEYNRNTTGSRDTRSEHQREKSPLPLSLPPPHYIILYSTLYGVYDRYSIPADELGACGQ